MKKLLFALIFCSSFISVNGQDIEINKSPEDYQLYARNENNKAIVEFQGRVLNKAYKKLELITLKDGKAYNTSEYNLKFNNNGVSGFSIEQEIEAGLFQYEFQLNLVGSENKNVFKIENIVCGDAYIITGQSNSHASSSKSTFQSPFARSFGVKTGYNPYTDEHKKSRWGKATGSAPDLDGVGAWFKDNPFGVGVWGMQLMEEIITNQKMPVCIINGGSGSSSIEQNMPETYQGDLNSSFGRLTYRVNQAGLTNSIKAILWHQGESNTNDKYRSYINNFDTLYNAWKSNFTSLEKVYLFQLHPGCGSEFQSELRSVQKSISDKYSDVEIMSTVGLPGHDGCHYTHEGYVAMAKRIYPLLARDFYGEKPSKSIIPPALQMAYISDRKSGEVCLEFDQEVVLQDKVEIKGSTYFLKDYLFYDAKNERSGVQNMTVDGNKIYLQTSDTVQYNRITYLPGHYYKGTKVTYNGPWIEGKNGIGALSFFNERVLPLKVTYQKTPANMQLIPRNDEDEGIIEIRGVISTKGFDKAICKLYRNDDVLETFEANLNYSNGTASFEFNPTIKAELAEYKVVIGFESNGEFIANKSIHSIVAGDVFLINGQSNSHPTRGEAVYRNEFARSFGSNTNYSAYNPADTTWGLAAGDVSQQYHVSAWGIKLMELLIENYKIPVAIINGGSGGSSIEYNLPVDDKSDLTSTYNRLRYRTEKAHVKDHIKGLLWHQGESNSNENSYANYALNFDTLYTAWKKDYPSIEKYFVFQIHPGCGGDRQSELRETERKFADTYFDVEVMSTVGLPGHDGCHYTKEGYSKMGERIFPLVARYFYDPEMGMDADAPNIKDAYYTKSKKEICLVFDQPISISQNAPSEYKLKDQFFPDGEVDKVNSISLEGEKLFITLSEKMNAETITYLPGHFYTGTNRSYNGPWVFGENGVGALSFDKFKIRKK